MGARYCAWFFLVTMSLAELGGSGALQNKADEGLFYGFVLVLVGLDVAGSLSSIAESLKAIKRQGEAQGDD